MKNLRNLLAVFTLMIFLSAGTVLAKDGLLVSDLTGSQQQSCTETKDDSKLDWGIIVQGLSGIIVQGFTGIIVQGAVDTNTDCGVIVHD